MILTAGSHSNGGGQRPLLYILLHKPQQIVPVDGRSGTALGARGPYRSEVQQPWNPKLDPGELHQARDERMRPHRTWLRTVHTEKVTG
jgi:hypothetical protein